MQSVRIRKVPLCVACDSAAQAYLGGVRVVPPGWGGGASGWRAHSSASVVVGIASRVSLLLLRLLLTWRLKHGLPRSRVCVSNECRRFDPLLVLLHDLAVVPRRLLWRGAETRLGRAHTRPRPGLSLLQHFAAHPASVRRSQEDQHASNRHCTSPR